MNTRRISLALIVCTLACGALASCSGDEEKPDEYPVAESPVEEPVAPQPARPQPPQDAMVSDACVSFCVKAIQCPDDPDYLDTDDCRRKCEGTLVTLAQRFGEACRRAALDTYTCAGRNSCREFARDIDELHPCHGPFVSFQEACGQPAGAGESGGGTQTAPADGEDSEPGSQI